MVIFHGYISHNQRVNPHENFHEKNSITPSPHHPIESGRITVEMYKDPTRMVDEMSALGLRHVGYGIPTAPWNGMNFSVKNGEKNWRNAFIWFEWDYPEFYQWFFTMNSWLVDHDGVRVGLERVFYLGSLVVCLLFSSWFTPTRNIQRWRIMVNLMWYPNFTTHPQKFS